MQVQYEAQLVEGPIIKSVDFTPEVNQALDAYVVHQPTLGAIEGLVTAPGGILTAVYQCANNQIVIIDTRNNSKLERFMLKPCDKKFSKQSFVAKSMDFSPDSSRLAVGQSDCILYIFKLSNSLNHQNETSNPRPKPIITSKFMCSSPVTCLAWIDLGIIFGTQDGKIKLGSMAPKQTNSDNQKSSTRVVSIYNSPKSSMPITISVRLPLLAVSFLDCSVAVISLTNDIFISGDTTAPGNISDSKRTSSTPLNGSFNHSCPAHNLAFLQNNLLCCAGSDGKLTLNLIQSEPITSHSFSVRSDLQSTSRSPSIVTTQNLDFKEDIVGLDYSSVNEILCVATTSRLSFVKYDPEQSLWESQPSFIDFSDVFSINVVKWARDGAQLLTGCSNGNLELFSCTWNKQSINDQFDVCHIAKNRVRITDKARNLLATYKSQYDIKKVNLLDSGQSVIIRTTNSLLMARLDQASQSEVQWSRDSNNRNGVKFSFEHQGFVLVYNSSSNQLNVIKLGYDSIVYSTKLKSVTRSKISARMYPINSHPSNATNDGDKNSPYHRKQSSGAAKTFGGSESTCERLSYVYEVDQLVVVNLKLGQKEMVVRHSEPIKRLSLSFTGENLIFVDAMSRLYLVDLRHSSEIEPKQRQISTSRDCHLVLEGCDFANWMPDSEILIAQASWKIYICYHMDDLKGMSTVDSRSFNITGLSPIVDLSLGLSSHETHPVIKRLLVNYQIALSNGQTFQLDKSQAKFYTELAGNRLESALEILERDENTKVANLRLWTKLGWLAIERCECGIAIRVFQELRHRNMVRYLEDCSAKPEELGLKLALLMGNWPKFEASAEPERIVATYKRLNRWSQLLEYLERSQQFRQVDLAEKEQRHWLVSRGRFQEAAKIQARTGDLVGALDLLMQHNQLDEATQLLVSEHKDKAALASKRGNRLCPSMAGPEDRLMELSQSLMGKLLDSDKLAEAALVCDKVLGQPERALELYLRGQSYEAALELARLVACERVASIESSYAEFLLQRHLKDRRAVSKDGDRVIELFQAAGQPVRALEASIELGRLDEGFLILRKLQAETDISLESADMVRVLSAASLAIARHKRAQSQLDEALEALQAGGQVEAAVELCIEGDRFEQAYRLSISLTDGEGAERWRRRLEELAERFVEEQQRERAEAVYLALERPELAIELWRKSGHHERMLELVQRFRPELMESSLLQLARQLEADGKLEEAEVYLLRLSENEWTNVVRMYRLANRWPDAYRVARQHCASAKDPLLVQLAYWWCKWLISSEEGQAKGAAAALSLLQSLDLLGPVLELSCEAANFGLASRLAALASPGQRGQVALREARHLEAEQQLAAAERVLMEAGLAEEACRMYLDNGLLEEAIRVAELAEQREGLLNAVLVDCAERLLAGEQAKGVPAESGSLLVARNRLNSARLEGASGKLEQAKQMYLRAQRPDLAVQMYRERGLWPEAIQVAQRFAPQLLERLEEELDAGLLRELVRPALREARSGRAPSGPELAGVGVPGAAAGPAARDEVARRLRSRAELLLREGDLSGAWAALAQFMDSLAEGGPSAQPEEPAGETGLLAERLLELTQLMAGLEPELASPGAGVLALEKALMGLADRMQLGCRWPSSHFLLGQQRPPSECAPDQSAGSPVWLAWTRMLHLLARWWRLRRAWSRARAPEEAAGGWRAAPLERLGRPLLLSHWVSLHGSLVLRLARLLGPQWRSVAACAPIGERARQLRQLARRAWETGELLRLLARLSLGLLRWAHHFACLHALHLAGFWLLAGGQAHLCRLAWQRLLELAQGGPEAPGAGQRSAEQAAAARLPIFAGAAAGQLRLGWRPSEQQLAELRACLLEALWDPSQAGQPDEQQDLWADLGPAGELQCCLVTALPAPSGGPQRGPAAFRVREPEWRRLEALAASERASGEPTGLVAPALLFAQRLILDGQPDTSDQ